jgi:hypothetical protein
MMVDFKITNGRTASFFRVKTICSQCSAAYCSYISFRSPSNVRSEGAGGSETTYNTPKSTVLSPVTWSWRVNELSLFGFGKSAHSGATGGPYMGHWYCMDYWFITFLYILLVLFCIIVIVVVCFVWLCSYCYVRSLVCILSHCVVLCAVCV